MITNNTNLIAMELKQKFLHSGLLFLRVALGISIFLHGIPKMMGGVETWSYLGSSMSYFGITFAPAFWGFLAAFAETVGGVLLALGLFFRPAAILLAGNMTVALATHLFAGDNFMVYGHALDLLIVYFSLIFIGAGEYSLDKKFFPKIA
ncbi:MAG: putative oxidoreductase [Bacteroidota bacterium]|jgi:putative oxidoreductase|nr:putative oxidoreductase [Bacteroidota bacterium]